MRTTSRGVARTLGGRYADNPIWFLRRVITVHPLGGAPMGRFASEGVVDPYGNVFGYPGLYVADGSVMPGPVGPEPQLHHRRARRPLRRPHPRDQPGQGGRRHMTSVRFTEEMLGHVTFGEEDFLRGAVAERDGAGALKFHLTIVVEDIDRFRTDPRRNAGAHGYLVCDALGGKLPVEHGAFNLFVDTEPGVKRMLYRLFFRDGAGHPLTLSGYKLIEDNAGFDVWKDTTTLFTRVLRGHVDEPGEADAEVVASGVLRIRARDFARQLTTFRGTLRALLKFNVIFLGQLAEAYLRKGRRAHVAA